MAIVTLLSDYGLDNSTVGLLKGIILSLAPQTVLVDLTHQLVPLDLAAGQFELDRAYRAFPRDTIHLAIVAPGLARSSQPVAFRAGDYWFVGPNNGLFSPILGRETVHEVVLLNPSVPCALGQLVSQGTFQGRDCYAPATGLLSAGRPLAELGSVLDPTQLQQLPGRPLQRIGDRMVATVQRVDHFGNLVTNLPAEWILNQVWRVRLAGHTVVFNPDQMAVGQQLRVRIGGHGFVELIFDGGQANVKLGCGVGQKVELFPL